MKPPVSLQINLAPGDYPHARHILQHQLDSLSDHVDEIILTVDTKPGKGRFATGWKENEKKLYDILEKDIASKYPVKITPVNYDISIKKEVAAYFFRKDYIPEKDFRGGPFYSYFFGLHSASNDLVFHLDSDIFLGGKSKTWIAEAVSLFDCNDDLLTVSPLPGPPHPDDLLIGQNIIKKIAISTYELDGMSTRVFMIDKAKFKSHKLTLSKPSIQNQVKSVIEGNSNADLPEHIFQVYMKNLKLKRIDFLGNREGLWSLHPPYRTKGFYLNLKELIGKIEQNDLPPKQHGFYDIIDDVCDWSEARVKLKKNRWWKRILANPSH